MATVTSREVEISTGMSDVAPVPRSKPDSILVGEGVPAVEHSSPPLSEPPDPGPVVSPLSGQSLYVSSRTLAWCEAGDSSVPLSPNRVQAGHSQDVPDEGSLFHVSPVSPGFLFRPLRATQQLPHDGVLLPTMLDEFNILVLCEPITYARCEQIPGSDSPLSLPVYALPSGSALMPGQSLVQTLLASGTSSRPGWGPLPSLLLWIWRTVRYWRRACRVVRTGSRRTVDSHSRMEIQRLACSFITHGFWSSSERRSRLACYAIRRRFGWMDQLGREQAMAAAVNVQRDAGIRLSNLQVLSQFTTSLHRMSSGKMWSWA